EGDRVRERDRARAGNHLPVDEDLREVAPPRDEQPARRIDAGQGAGEQERVAACHELAHRRQGAAPRAPDGVARDDDGYGAASLHEKDAGRSAVESADERRASPRDRHGAEGRDPTVPAYGIAMPPEG